jgi:hypothetical protein
VPRPRPQIFEAVEAGLVAQVTSGAGAAAATLQGHVIRLRGLPFASSAEDVAGFLAPVQPVGAEGGVVFTCTPDGGRPTGEAYVEVGSPEDKAAALGKHKERLGTRYIEVFESSKGDMFHAVHLRGFYTAEGGTRRHHPPAARPPGGAGAPPAPPRAPGGRGGGVEDMVQSFGAFGISHRDVQVPGPARGGGAYPRYAADDARHHSARPQMVAAAPGGGGGAPHWVTHHGMGGPQQGRPGGQFNPAPGPAGAPPGGRGVPPRYYAYSGAPMLMPFMAMPHQHAFVQQQQQQQQQAAAAAWGGGMMAPQAGGGWFHYAQQAQMMHHHHQMRQQQQQHMQQVQRGRPQQGGGIGPATLGSPSSGAAAELDSGRVRTVSADAGSVASAGSAESSTSAAAGGPPPPGGSPRSDPGSEDHA